MLRNCACLVIAHMVDATQLCLSCNCTHGGCYATVLVLSLHTWWMLRNWVCLVIAHMVDATQLSLSCNCTHGGCYATEFVLSLHTWWMLRNCACLLIAHMVDATQLCLSCNCTHGGCYATLVACPLVFQSWQVRSASIRHGNNWKDTYRKSFAAATKPPDVTTIVWRNMFGRFCSEWTCGRSCLKHWANWPKKQTMLQDRKKKRLFFGGGF